MLDLGVAFSTIVALYSVLPLLGLWLAEQGVGEILDSRFPTLPSAEAITEAGLCYAAFLSGFVWCYGLTRRESAQQLQVWRPSRSDVWRVVVGFTVLRLGLAATTYFLDIPDAEDYGANYLALHALPLVVQQVMGVLYSMDFAVAVLFIVTTIAYWPERSNLVLLVVFAIIGMAFIVGGSRSEAFLCGFAWLVARTIYGRPLNVAARVLGGVAGVALFTLAGAMRGDTMHAGYLNILQGGEFLLVFHNGVDLIERGASAQDLGIMAPYATDLLRLIPQQIVGDIKVSPATAYVETFYPAYAAAGGGLVFGAIAESVLGFGWPEALVRGALLGVAYAWVANRCLAGKLTGRKVFIYAWFVVMAYWGVRDTTFSVFARFVFQVLPVLVVLKFTGTFRRRPAAGVQVMRSQSS